jgi:hypothetical protein
MSDMEIWIVVLFTANALTTIIIAMVIDQRLTKIESRLRNKYRR